MHASRTFIIRDGRRIAREQSLRLMEKVTQSGEANFYFAFVM